MSVPSFGPSQRLELSRLYLDCNDSDVKCDKYRLYDRVDSRENVAEEGQVVLLHNVHREGSGMDHCKTEVIPDAAGYQVEFDHSSMDSNTLMCYLQREITSYNIGVNQIERGVNIPHCSSGYGWDISVASSLGQNVTIRHTGSERIHRFDMIGVRFPTHDDVEAQTHRWNANGRSGITVSKFATYPIRENWDLVQHKRFAADLHALTNDIQHGYSISCHPRNAIIRHIQLPALLRLVGEVTRAVTEERKLKDGLDDCAKHPGGTSFDMETSQLLTTEEGVSFLNRIAVSAYNFTSTLRPPKIIAQCLSFQCVQPHAKSWAECGDLLNCVFV